MNVDAITFNAWKHHAGFVKSRISIVDSMDSLNELNNNLFVIGSTLMDFYFGELKTNEIIHEAAVVLNSRNIRTRKSFSDYVNARQGYQIIRIGDGSSWVLRLSEDAVKYVHIHPAKYSILTIRVRALTLKTAILAAAYSNVYKTLPQSIDVVNLVRKTFLNEPPVKFIKPEKGLGKIIGLLTSVSQADRHAKLFE